MDRSVKSLEQPPVDPPVDQEFRMPLDAHGEVRLRILDRLRDVELVARDDREIGTDPVDRLVVQAVDAQGGALVDPGEPTVVDEVHRLGRQWRPHLRYALEDGVDVLVQRALILLVSPLEDLMDIGR